MSKLDTVVSYCFIHHLNSHGLTVIFDHRHFNELSMSSRSLDRLSYYTLEPMRWCYKRNHTNLYQRELNIECFVKVMKNRVEKNSRLCSISPLNASKILKTKSSLEIKVRGKLNMILTIANKGLVLVIMQLSNAELTG